MTWPSADFPPVAPPPDGLAIAFASARRRRNGKAAVTLFGGVVAIASALSLLAPPGQSLVQKPLPPAHSTAPGVPTSGSPGAATGSPLRTRPVAGATTAEVGTSMGVGTTTPSAVVAPGALPATTGEGCTRGRWLTCKSFDADTAGHRTRAEVDACETAVRISVSYSLPVAVPGPTTGQRDITIGSGSCDS